MKRILLAFLFSTIALILFTYLEIDDFLSGWWSCMIFSYTVHSKEIFKLIITKDAENKQ